MTNAQGDATPMDESSLLVHAYLDGELDPANSLTIAQQIAADPALSAKVEHIQALRHAVRERLPREPLPPHLRARIETAIGRRGPQVHPSWRALAASVVFTMALASGSTWVALRPVSGDRIAEAVVDSHVRALMAPQPTDVTSSERHTVKPWFNGRIPQSPQVVDLTKEGFPLVGGRVDVIETSPAATLVYGRRLHLISLLAVPSASSPQGLSVRRSIRGVQPRELERGWSRLLGGIRPRRWRARDICAFVPICPLRPLTLGAGATILTAPLLALTHAKICC